MACFYRKEQIWHSKIDDLKRKKLLKERKRVEKYILHKNYFSNKNSDDGKTEETV